MIGATLLKRNLSKILVCLIIVTCYSWYHLHRLASKSNNYPDIYAKIKINLNIGDNNNRNNNKPHETTAKPTNKSGNGEPEGLEQQLKVTERTRYPPFIEPLIKPKTAPQDAKSLEKTLIEAFYQQNNHFVNLTLIKNTEIIFVGGYGRSGTTLMRAILDVHTDIRCGPETKIIMSLLNHVRKYVTTRGVIKDLKEAGVKNQTIDDAMALFIYHVIANHGQPAKRLCMKDPDVLQHISYLHHLFPNAKFVYMIRDGRGAAYSFILRVKEKVTTSKFKSYLTSWNTYNKNANEQCKAVGSKLCMRVKYEELVKETNKTMRSVIKFLNETWEDKLLEHQKFIGSEIAISNIEWSTDQIKKPINKDSLTSWIYKIPYLEEKIIRQVAPMIEYFGYNLSVNSTIIEKQKANARMVTDDMDRFRAADRLRFRDMSMNPNYIMNSIEEHLKHFEKANFPR